MYEKNLNHSIKVRISDRDYRFLIEYSDRLDCSVSDTVRALIGEYRRSVETMEKVKELGLLS